MELITNVWNLVREYLPTMIAAGVVLLVLFLAQRLLERRRKLASGFRLTSQVFMVGLTLAGLVLVIVVLPIKESLRGNLLTFLGILLSVAVALSSTTFLGNAMAGIMLRAVRNFRTGDFIRVGDHFGRVSERGLFHTEIQTENRDLITLPNFFLVTHPVTTIRTSGTIVAATVSLGYDVPRKRVEKALLEAAGEAGLEDPFVQVKQLGDFSVTYRIAGLLTEVKQLLTARSGLRKHTMDKLHEYGIEIVSPTYMNTRAVGDDRQIIPDEAGPATAAPESAFEDVVFDKAEEAESLESLKEACDRLAGKLDELKKQDSSEEERESLQKRIDHLREVIARREKAAEKD
jgi:small-conductance mechanosensitive channel